jgi:hypothetical protein
VTSGPLSDVDTCTARFRPSETYLVFAFAGCRRSPEPAGFFLAREILVIIRAEGASGLTG